MAHAHDMLQLAEISAVLSCLVASLSVAILMLSSLCLGTLLGTLLFAWAKDIGSLRLGSGLSAAAHALNTSACSLAPHAPCATSPTLCQVLSLRQAQPLLDVARRLATLQEQQVRF